MKNLRFFSFAFILFLFSCSKEKTVPANTIYATISGTTETFTIKVQVEKNPGNPDGYEYGIGLTAFNPDASKSDNIGVYVYAHKPITAGTYTFTYQLSSASSSSTFLSYAVSPSDFDYIPDETKPEPATIVITSISANNIKGTFTGTLKGTNDRWVTITNGKFNVNY